MNPLPIWNERLKGIQIDNVKRNTTFKLKKSVSYYSSSITFVDSREKAQNMVVLAQQRALSHIGIDTEFKYDRPGVMIDRNNTAQDPRSIHPLLLSLALAEPRSEEGGTLYTFVIDLRIPEVVSEIEPLFKLPVCFVGHNLKVELFCLWQLKLPEPNIIWDTLINEKALYLGCNHFKYKLKNNTDEIEEIITKEATTKQERFTNSLTATCQRYGVPYAFEQEKKRLQESFLSHGDKDTFSKEQIYYAAEDALAASRLYPFQTNVACQKGILLHLISVEMPWTKTNASFEWRGVKVDVKKGEALMSQIEQYRLSLEEHIKNFGVGNIRSHKQMELFFEKEGLLPQFKKHGKISFERKVLKQLQHLHPVIPLIRAVRRMGDLKADKIMFRELIGTDGRMHPQHNQLGARTGRQTSRWPNILGLDKVLRPLIIPEPGRGIGEVDWSQVEVGIAAAVYNDNKLVNMFNTGDVYSAMAQSFFHDELTPEARNLPGHEFKRIHPDLRNKMKTCTLGIIYGLKIPGLAQELNTTIHKAKALYERFMAMFLALKDALSRGSALGTIQGYASSISGLRRYRGRPGKPSGWEKNWLINFPVQGSAAIVFKAAGNRLYKLYQQYDAWLTIPLHDAYIFESPLEHLHTVAELTERVMCETIQEYFPELQPRVEINITQYECWNKDGDTEPLAKWIENDLIKILTKHENGDKEANKS